MLEEQEYGEIITAVAIIDPILDRWSQRYGGHYAFDLHERLRASILDNLKASVATAKDITHIPMN